MLTLERVVVAAELRVVDAAELRVVDAVFALRLVVSAPRVAVAELRVVDSVLRVVAAELRVVAAEVRGAAPVVASERVAAVFRLPYVRPLVALLAALRLLALATPAPDSRRGAAPVERISCALVLPLLRFAKARSGCAAA